MGLVGPLRLWLPNWLLIPSQVLTSALGLVRNSGGVFFIKLPTPLNEAQFGRWFFLQIDPRTCNKIRLNILYK